MQAPAQQPIGFWTVKAGEAVAARVRERLAEVGVTQPEWWVLHQLSLHPDGLTETDLLAVVGPHAGDEVIEQAVRDGLRHGWVERRDDVVRWTDAGRERFEAAARVQGELDRERRVGVSDADHETTIRVLQRTVVNVGGEAWHW